MAVAFWASSALTFNSAKSILPYAASYIAALIAFISNDDLWLFVGADINLEWKNIYNCLINKFN